MRKINTIFILAPHTDDGELGCGGTIAKYIEEGKNVYYITFSICEDSVPDGFPKDILHTEVKLATAELGIKKENLIVFKYPVRRFPEYRQEILENLVKLNNELSPDLIFLPSSFDVHQDHKVIFEEGRRAFKRCSMLGYEFMWNNFEYNTSTFIILEEKHVLKKVKAISQYKSQKRRFYAQDEMVIGQSKFRGLQIFKPFAEAFETIRWII